MRRHLAASDQLRESRRRVMSPSSSQVGCVEPRETLTHRRLKWLVQIDGRMGSQAALLVQIDRRMGSQAALPVCRRESA